jgi:predicted SAM-dependent methyltransferase
MSGMATLSQGCLCPTTPSMGVYCSYVLEHLSLQDFRTALKNTYAILNRNGVFRLVLPDLDFSIHKYINDTSPSAANNL